MRYLDDNQAILTIRAPDPDWILAALPDTWDCDLVQDFEDYTPRIVSPGRQVFGAEVYGIQISVSGSLDAVEEMRSVFQQEGTLNTKRCRSGYAFLVTVDLGEKMTQASRVQRIQQAIARSQYPTPALSAEQLVLI